MGAAEELNRKEQIRYHLLRRAYEITGGAKNYFFEFPQLGEDEGFSHHETRLAMDYLIGEGLIQPRTLGGGCSITHQGVIEIENSIRKPEEPTEHFEPVHFSVVNHNTFHGPVGAIQHGAGTVANVSQNITTNVAADVKVLLTQLHDQVRQAPEEVREDADQMLGELEQEASSDKPKSWKVKALLAGLSTVLGGTASSILSELSLKLLGAG